MAAPGGRAGIGRCAAPAGLGRHARRRGTGIRHARPRLGRHRSPAPRPRAALHAAGQTTRAPGGVLARHRQRARRPGRRSSRREPPQNPEEGS